jgi:hypothetical protein
MDGVRTRLLIRTGCAIGLLLASGSVGLAQEWDWAGEMFDHTSHDFGTVARGAKVEHRFPFENKYVEDVHVDSVRSTCGCTTPKIVNPALKTWQKGAIVAQVDTRSYLGRKDATLTVVFDKPYPAEVRLQVRTYIRSDVVVQPGVVQFGTVAQGSAARKKVTVDYAGRRDWRIERVECKNPHLTARAVETSRTEGTVTYVSYALEVTLSNQAPAGYIRDQLTLVTNDTRTQASRVPVPVEGVVASAISVSPSPLLLPAVDPGGSVAKQLAVRGQSAFKVVGVRCDDDRMECSIRQVSDRLSLIRVAFTAGNAPGKVQRMIYIKTDHDPDREIPVAVHGRVMAPEP